MRKLIAAAVVAAGAFSPAVFADSDHGKMGHGRHGASAPAMAMSEGEVRKVDKDAKKLTVRHGPLPELDMPQAMTMVYRVKDPAMLDKVKPGDKIRFHAENINGTFTLTAIEPAR